MRKLFFDIETAPAPVKQHKAVAETYRAAKARGSKLPDTFRQYLASTSLMGEFGRIVAIGCAINDGSVKVATGTERNILKNFWQAAAKADLFIGHNVLEFDFPFIMKRSRLLGVPPSKTLSFARYKSHPIYDTMKEWNLWAFGGISLDTLARAYGLTSSKGYLDGSRVAEYFENGRIEEIAAYCAADVELTRDIYKRMTFEDEPAVTGTMAI